MSRHCWSTSSSTGVSVAWYPRTASRLQPICHLRLSLDVSPLLKRPEGVIDTSVQGHTPRLRHNHFDRSLPGAGALCEHIDHQKEQQFPFATEHRVKAPAGRVEPLEGPEKAFNGIGGRGQPDTAHTADELRQLCLDMGDPRGDAQRWRLLAQARQASADRAFIVGLKHLLHHPLARGDLLLRGKMLLQPVGDALLVMKATQDVLGPWHHGSIGW